MGGGGPLVRPVGDHFLRGAAAWNRPDPWSTSEIRIRIPRV